MKKATIINLSKFTPDRNTRAKIIRDARKEFPNSTLEITLRNSTGFPLNGGDKVDILNVSVISTVFIPTDGDNPTLQKIMTSSNSAYLITP